MTCPGGEPLAEKKPELMLAWDFDRIYRNRGAHGRGVELRDAYVQIQPADKSAGGLLQSL